MAESARERQRSDDGRNGRIFSSSEERVIADSRSESLAGRCQSPKTRRRQPQRRKRRRLRRTVSSENHTRRLPVPILGAAGTIFTGAIYTGRLCRQPASLSEKVKSIRFKSEDKDGSS